MCFSADGGWGGPNQGQPGQQQLSVVTTVWNSTPATQSGPFTNQYPSIAMTGAGMGHVGGNQSAGYPAGAMPKVGAGGGYNPGAITYHRDSLNRYAVADGSGHHGMMSPGTPLSPHLPMGVMSPGAPPHVAGVRHVTAHTQVHTHAPAPGPSPLGGAGVGGVVGGAGGPSRMLVPSGHPGRSNSQGPLDSSPLNPMVGVQSPLHQILQAHSPMSGAQAQSPAACVRQGPSPLRQGSSPLTPTMLGQSPLNAAMAGQVQAPTKPHMHPSPLHGDPGSR